MSLSKLTALDRRQIEKIIGNGTRWTNKILNELKNDDLVTYRESNTGRVYKLTKKSCGIFECKYLWGWGNIEHTLLRNSVIIDRCGGWDKTVKVEADIRLNNVSYGVCDAMINRGHPYIIEIDRWQKWQANVTKLKRYGELKNKGVDFTLVWVVEMESRIPKIKKICKELGLKCDIYNKEETRLTN